jgi:hypothetical protein
MEIKNVAWKKLVGENISSLLQAGGFKFQAES